MLVCFCVMICIQATMHELCGEGKRTMEEVSCMSQIPLVIHSMIRYFNPEPEFTLHERQEQEYSLHRARNLSLAGHPPAHPVQLTEGCVGGCLKTAPKKPEEKVSSEVDMP